MTRQEFLDKHNPFSQDNEYPICIEVFDHINSLPPEMTAQEIYDSIEYPSWLIWYVEHYYHNCTSIIRNMCFRLIKETPVGDKILLDLVPDTIVKTFIMSEKENDPKKISEFHFIIKKNIENIKYIYNYESNMSLNKKLAILYACHCISDFTRDFNTVSHLASVINFSSMLAVEKVGDFLIGNARKVQCKIIRECFPEVF